MMKKILVGIPVFLILGIGLALFYFYYDFAVGKKSAEKNWEERKIVRITDLGTTKTLTILPLLELVPGKEGLKGESGLSYLIKTDNATILLDTGLNWEKESPSPLLHNMKQLGISLDDFDTLVISHNHMDHVGGMKYQSMKSFSIDRDQIPLGKKRIYTPIPMTYPGQDPVYVEKPQKIAEGITTTGGIHNHLYMMGAVSEQAIAVNLKGKGIIIISACGHQTLPKLLQQTKELFAEPLYGIIGGLHYPVTPLKGNMNLMGIPLQNYLGTGNLPWKPITIEEVNQNIALLKSYDPKYVALSPHDSCQLSINTFKQSFGSAYHEIKTGVPLTVQ
jgi:7,8-dihydropterin-6-yl-methyl-4-(beta-D-ribofuranosyl)aminobenzene 5'-phosphate synthase